MIYLIGACANKYIAEAVKKMLAEKGFDPIFGARPLKRVIQNMILDELAMQIIEGKIPYKEVVFFGHGIGQFY